MRYTLTLPAGAATLTVTADTPSDLLAAATAIDVRDLATLAPAPSARTPKATGDTCQHGARVARQGTSERGPWSALFCPLPSERKAEQCPPVWLDVDAPAAAAVPAAEPAPW